MIHAIILAVMAGIAGAAVTDSFFNTTKQGGAYAPRFRSGYGRDGVRGYPTLHFGWAGRGRSIAGRLAWWLGVQKTIM